MDLSKVFEESSGAADELKYLGLRDGQVQTLVRELGGQLGKLAPSDLTSLDESEVLGKLDLDSLAEQVGVPQSLAGAAVQLLLPKVRELLGGDASSALNVASKLAGRFSKP